MRHSEKEGHIDQRLISLSLLIARMLPSMGLEHILTKVRDEQIWQTYVVTRDDGQVIGGAVLRDHSLTTTSMTTIGTPSFAELSLLAMD